MGEDVGEEEPRKESRSLGASIKKSGYNKGTPKLESQQSAPGEAVGRPLLTPDSKAKYLAFHNNRRSSSHLVEFCFHDGDVGDEGSGEAASDGRGGGGVDHDQGRNISIGVSTFYGEGNYYFQHKD